MSDFKSVDRYQLQRAFAIAHKAAQSGETRMRERKIFRAVAALIWESCREAVPYQPRLAPDVEEQLALIVQMEKAGRI